MQKGACLKKMSLELTKGSQETWSEAFAAGHKGKPGWAYPNADIIRQRPSQQYLGQRGVVRPAPVHDQTQILIPLPLRLAQAPLLQPPQPQL